MWPMWATRMNRPWCTVFIENEKAISEYCKRHGLDFAEVTTEA